MEDRLLNRSCFSILAVVLVVLTVALAAVPAAAEDTQTKHYNLAPLAEDLRTGMEYRRVMAVQILGKVRNPEAVGMLITAMLRDRSDVVRRSAQRELAGVEDARVFPAVRTALADRDRRVRLAGLEALGLVRDPAAADLILQTAAADPKDGELQRLSLEALRIFVYHVEPPPGFENRVAVFLQDPDDKLRRNAAAILGILARPASVEPLLALWPKADDKLRIVLADAFANIGWAKPVPVLIAALPNGNTNLVIHSLYALSQIQAFSALKEIRTTLEKNRDARVRIAGLNALIEVPDPENVPEVLRLLDDRDATVRHWAAYALGELDAQAAVPALRSRLQDRDSLVRATAATALASLRAKAAEPDLVARLGDPKETSDVRVAAARALMALGSRAGSDTYWAQLQNPKLDRDSRMTYALALGACRDERFTERLLQDLTSPDFTRGFCAALTLAAMGKTGGQTILMQALDHGDPFVRRYAILGLENLPNPEVLKALGDTANDDPDPVVRVLCAASLVAAGHAEYRVMLWNVLDNKDEDVRSEAVVGLGRNADAAVLKQLKWYLRREPSVPVREIILRILRRRSA